MRSRRRTSSILALCAGAALAVVPAAASPAASADPGGATARMLVFLRVPRSSSGASARALAVAPQRAIGALTRELGGRVLGTTAVPDTLTAALSASAAGVLRSDPRVAVVLPDATIPGPTSAGAHALGAAAARGAVVHAPCGTAQHPELAPEGLANVDAVGADLHGFTGRGVTVAFLADGLQVNDPDLLRGRAYASSGSPAGSRVISQYEDFSGDGTAAPTDGAEAFGDAASIAAQGNARYDLSRYVSRAHPLPRGCDVRVVGTAPGASLLALKIFAQRDDTTGSGFVQAVAYAVAHGARVINESFGSNPFPDGAADIVRLADDAAVAAGVTVVVSSGDAGTNSTIGSPASDPNVISVGASTTFRAYVQDTYGGINWPGGSGRYLDDNISALSSGGVAQDGATVDLVAPGDLNWSLCSANARQYSGCSGMNLQLFGGTSEASPMTAGAAADVIQAYANAHAGTRPTPALVKQILMSTARDVGAPADEQGAGLLDVGAAIELARSMPGTTLATRPGGLAVDATQLDLSGLPGTVATGTVHVTNTSEVAVTLGAAVRALVPAGGTGGRIVLRPGDPKAPTFEVWSGAPEVYRAVAFRVPRGIGRVVLHAAYQYEGQSSLLHVALFDPTGALAGYSLPQGIGDYGTVEVARPRTGLWHAVFFTVRQGWQGNSGTSGPVPYSISYYRFGPLGTAGPASQTVAAGATATVTYHVTLPTTPGDADAAIVLRAGSTIATVPVILRTEMALGSTGGTFVGTLLGGNGRGGAPGQTNTYDLVVPSGRNDLDVAVRLASNPGAGEVPGVQLVALLVDPDGQTVSYGSNYTVNQTQGIVTRTVQLYADQPVAGTWQLVLDWVQPGAGRNVALPYRVLVAFDQVSASAPLPDSPTTTVPLAGATYDLRVTNTGIAELLVAPDARLSATATLPLADLESDAATQSLPDASNVYFVPTESSSLQVTVQGTTETTFDTGTWAGDPDLSPTNVAPYATGSLTPTEAQVTYAPPTGVASGIWGVVQDEVGPYPASGMPAAQETTSFDVVARAFDPAVSSSVPDTVESLALGGSVDPVAVPPGGMLSLPITITPTAATGTVVSGTLYVTGFTAGSFFGPSITAAPCFTSVLAAIPYEYKVGS